MARLKPRQPLLTLAFLLCAIVVLEWASIRAIVEDGYENVAYAFDPSANRAFAYGERHFDSANPTQYDIGRAEYFFKLAAAKDLTLPYVYHELARIDFLKGNFNSALAKINFQIQMQGDTTPNSYYIRGLIEGYMEEYKSSAKDYEHFLQSDPRNWAALNDYAWVLLKAQRFQDAADTTARGLVDFPENPWLLNSRATALYEMHQYPAALAAAQKANTVVANVTEVQWLHAYPGNDPKIGGEGLAAFKKAISDNMHTIQLALASDTVQSE